MISIITTAYKNVKYIEEAIDSAIQSVGKFEFELLVGIDNCIDTLNKCYDLKEKYNDSIKFLYFTEHSGTYIIRNTLANEAIYENLLFFDSDDIIHKDLIKSVLSGLEKNEHIRYKYLTFHDTLTKEDIINNKITNHYHTGTFGIKKEVFMIHNGFEPWICAADGEFYWRLMANKVKSLDLDILGIYYRRHQTNLTSKKETSMNSPLRKSYHKLKNDKINMNKYQPLSELKISNFIDVRRININNFNSDYKKNVDLSIIIPTYKNINFLDESIISVLNATLEYNIEILIGVDGCEESLEFLKESTYPNYVKMYYFEDNMGPYTIKNTLAEKAKSENLLFFDSDDIMNQNMIQEIINGLKNYACVKPKFSEFGGKSLGGTTFGEGVFGIQKNLFISMNGFEPWMMAADSDFMNRLYKKKLKILHTPQILFKRRVHPDSLTNRKDTGLRSIERARYARISKNKRGDGNPKILHKRNYIVIDTKTNENLLTIKQRELENRKRILDSVLSPQPRKVVIKQNKKGPQVTNDNRLDFLSQPKKVQEKITHNNPPENRQDLINKKKSQITKTIRDHFPKKTNNREGKNMINLGGKNRI